MKKSLVLLLCLGFCLVGSACSGDGENERNAFTALKAEETLRVGGSDIFKNIETTEEHASYLTYTESIAYSLVRSYYYNSVNYVEYNGYYYYWSVNEVKQERLLGNKTVKTSVDYSYLVYTENQNIAVQTVRTVETSYDYEGGVIEIDLESEVELNGYFTSIGDMQEKCPELAKGIDLSIKRKYFVDVVTPIRKEYSTKTYTDTFYYFE